MEIVKTQSSVQQKVTQTRIHTSTPAFDQVLAQKIKTNTFSSPQQHSTTTLIEVGTITKQTPTVSELLLAHDELKTTAWQILADSRNQNKAYTTIQPGTTIFFDKKTGALSWAGGKNAQATSASTRSVNSIAKEANTPIQLGKINSSTPTVSHLLHNDPRFHEQTWTILNQPVNAGKAFHKMAPGSEVMLHPATMEISWSRPKQTTPVDQPVVAHTTKEALSNDTRTPPFTATDLSEAVQPYMGKSYKEVNCYELLVNGLKQLDIPYNGSNGLYSRLTRMALDRGLPANAYLNGEGIVEVAGATVFFKNYTDLDNWKQDSIRLVREITPLLNSGQILSFSTQTRGHTGIISRQENEWTFINSGRLDNAIDRNALSKGVGEELLDNEIQNWFKLAHTRGETLKVTLGELSQEKLRTIADVGKLTDNRI